LEWEKRNGKRLSSLPIARSGKSPEIGQLEEKAGNEERFFRGAVGGISFRTSGFLDILFLALKNIRVLLSPFSSNFHHRRLAFEIFRRKGKLKELVGH
jgi:hypothetical protein